MWIKVQAEIEQLSKAASPAVAGDANDPRCVGVG
jgi:hypothetical protein